MSSGDIIQKTIHISYLYTVQKATIQQVTTMLASSKTALFPGHNHLLTVDADYMEL